MGECSLFGVFGGLVQATLAALCLMSLVGECYFSETKLIQDASKQGIAAAVAHGLNILIALMLSHGEQACVWYFVNLTFEILVGVVFNYVLLKLLNSICESLGVYSLVSGHYIKNGEGRVQFGSWFVQLLAWLIIVMIVSGKQTKVWVALGIYVCRHSLGAAAVWVLEPLSPHPHLELVVVMIVWPILLNLFQFWVQDNFLKASPTLQDHKALGIDSEKEPIIE